jgi:hypothetical protein
MAPFAEMLLQRLLDIIGNPETPQVVNENAAIALSRLGLENIPVHCTSHFCVCNEILGIDGTNPLLRRKSMCFHWIYLSYWTELCGEGKKI